MDFGNVSNVEGIPFELPPEEARSMELLRSKKSTAKRKVYVGAPLWGVKEWVGKVYPPKTPAKDFLREYARQFNSIELNSTFYRIPDKKTLRAWAETVPVDFRFSPKIPQEISRSLASAAPRMIQDACLALEELGDRLGVSFLQLPPSFSPKSPRNVEALERLARSLPRGFRLALEFRHPDWFERHALIDDAYELLKDAGIATVITDTAGRRDVVHASITAPTVFVRFLGNELHPSDFIRLEHWIRRLKVWMKAGVTEVYFFMHHGTYVNVPELAKYFVDNANASWGSKLRTWEQVAPRLL